jgi:hypothetical protein
LAAITRPRPGTSSVPTSTDRPAAAKLAELEHALDALRDAMDSPRGGVKAVEQQINALHQVLQEWNAAASRHN